MIWFGIFTAVFVGALIHASLTTSEEDDGGHDRLLPSPVLLPASLKTPADADTSPAITDPFRKEAEDEQDPECFQSSRLTPWTFRSLSNSIVWGDARTSEWVYKTPIEITFVDGLGEIQVARNDPQRHTGWYCKTKLRRFNSKTQRLLTNTLLHELGDPPNYLTNVEIWMFLDNIDPKRCAKRARHIIITASSGSTSDDGWTSSTHLAP